MKYSNDLVVKSQYITQQVAEAERLHRPIEGLVRQQIEIMEASYDEFVKEADAAGIDNLQRAKIEIQLCANIKAWANKIGLSTEKYDNTIKAIQKRFGVDN